MKRTIDLYQFRDAFQALRPDNFTYEGLAALFDYLEELEEDTGMETELDVIAICCDFAEYNNPLDCAKDHGYEEAVDLEPHGSVDLLEVAELENKQALEWLQERTQVIEIPGTSRIIIQGF